MEVQWLDGVILVTDPRQATFVPFTQVDTLLRKVRARPNGQMVVERLCMALIDDHDGEGAKPVLVDPAPVLEGSVQRVFFVIYQR